MRLYAFQGLVSVVELVGKDDCVLLIPAATSGSSEVTIEDPTKTQQTTIRLDVQSICFIAGRCSIRVEAQSKIISVALGVGKNKE